jgi:hypothetical protein
MISSSFAFSASGSPGAGAGFGFAAVFFADAVAFADGRCCFCPKARPDRSTMRANEIKLFIKREQTPN